MRILLSDIEAGKDIKMPKKKKKKMKLTHLPEEEIPYSKRDFAKYIDTSYESHEGE
jgi:hypothetical protein